MKKVMKEKWILGNEEDGTSPWTLGQWGPAFMEKLKQIHGKPFRHAFEFTSGHMKWLVPEKESGENARELLSKVLESPEYYDELSVKVTQASKRLHEFSERVLKTDVSAMSNGELAALFEEHTSLITNSIAWGMMSTLTEVPRPLFTTHLEKLLEKKIPQARNATKSPAEYFAILSSITHESEQRRELRALLKMASTVLGNAGLRKAFAASAREGLSNAVADGNAYGLMKAHAREFVWAYYGYVGPALSVEKVAEELHHIATEERKIEEHLKRMDDEMAAVPGAIMAAEEELQLTGHEKALFKAIRSTVFMKVNRKDAMVHAFYAMEAPMRELAKRTGISEAKAHGLMYYEVRPLLEGKLVNVALKERLEHTVYACDTDKCRLFSGSDAEEFIESIYAEDAVGSVTEIVGKCACTGRATGRVKIINTPNEMGKMEKGDVLVSIATTPDIVMAMKKAAAIVTNEGGITSHAAIVSREIGVPCVIGTKIATKALKDGDLVEVDATNGIVRKL